MLKENNSKDIINKLSESPIYAMSLGNHELFHSNFWAWIMENDSNFVKELFGDEISGYEIKREFYNTDIAIIVGENVYVMYQQVNFTQVKYAKQITLRCY